MTEKKPRRRKKRRIEEIRKEIVEYLEKADFPTTTGQIAEGVGLNWYSADAHLAHLKAEKKVFHKRVGRQNQWWTEKVAESRRMVRVLKEENKEKDEKIDELESDNKELEKEVEDYKERVEDVEGVNEKLEEESRGKDKKIEELKKRIRELEKRTKV